MVAPKNAEKSFVPRVTQLDAVSLDKEINHLVKSQLVSILQIAHPEILTKWEPEIDAILGLLIWKLSVAKSHATFGHQLLGIRYIVSSKRRVWSLAALLIGGKYAVDRSRSFLAVSEDDSFRILASKILHWCRVIVQAASLVNIAIFLREGKYPTLTDRIMNLRPVPVSSNVSRSIGYTYMTRELLWHGFIELLVFVLPMVNYPALRSRILALFRRNVSNEDTGCIPPRLDHHSSCAICSQPPILPYHIGCGHVFCAYCLNASVLADSKFECPLCGASSANNVRPVQL